MTHTSESLKALDSDLDNYHYQLNDGERYQLTNDEMGWLKFISGRYSIYDHINENLDSDGIYTVDTIGMTEALADDGSCKAVCLSDDTTLQAIFFYSSHCD